MGSHDDALWVPVHRQGKYTWYLLAQGEGLFARLPWLLALGLALGAPTSRTSGRCVGPGDSAWRSPVAWVCRAQTYTTPAGSVASTQSLYLACLRKGADLSRVSSCTMSSQFETLWKQEEQKA